MNNIVFYTVKTRSFVNPYLCIVLLIFLVILKGFVVIHYICFVLF